MAISRERLDELIDKGVFIFYIYNEKSIGIIQLDKSYGISVDKYNEINKCKPVFYHKGNVYQDICDADKIFETKEQAEWYIKYHATRTEELNLPMWEEFIKEDNTVISFWKNGHKITLYKYIKNKRTNNITIMVLDDMADCECWRFKKPATEENYTKACDLCLKLFKEGV